MSVANNVGNGVRAIFKYGSIRVCFQLTLLADGVRV